MGWQSFTSVVLKGLPDASRAMTQQPNAARDQNVVSEMPILRHTSSTDIVRPDNFSSAHAHSEIAKAFASPRDDGLMLNQDQHFPPPCPATVAMMWHVICSRFLRLSKYALATRRRLHLASHSNVAQ